MDLLPDKQNFGLRMRRECREVFPATDFKGNHGLAITACITARASRTCRDACGDHQPVKAGNTLPVFQAHAQPAVLRIWQEANDKGSYMSEWNVPCDVDMIINWVIVELDGD